MKSHYQFKNGVTVDFILQDIKNNPIQKVEWSCELNKKNIAPLMDEYANECIPKVYQEIANFIGTSISWVDKNGFYLPKTFTPNNKN